MINILNLLTKKGRQKVVRTLLTENLTKEAVSEYAREAVNTQILARVENKEKLERVATVCASGADLFGTIATAAKDGEITSDEALDIVVKVNNLTQTLVSEERIAALIDRVVAQVP